ncbi:zinc finger protein 239-like [Kogia breviceps]|uniref:zinc finger protein 239-like n=1 Tax=Kogia breviceps TaxID=27615 RepID=UPI0034D28D35
MTSSQEPVNVQGCDRGLHPGGVGAAGPRTKGPVQRGKKPYDCAECGKSFSQSTELHIHQRVHMRACGLEPVSPALAGVHMCDTCGKGFSYNTNLHVHQRVHTGEKPFKCEECGKGFRQSSNLCIHWRVHTGAKLYKCEKCCENFRQKVALQEHHRVHTRETVSM